MLSSEGQLLRLLKWSGEYVSQSGNAQQWGSASQVLEVAWRGTVNLSSFPQLAKSAVSIKPPGAFSHVLLSSFPRVELLSSGN
jgi:hypothetical protein